MKRNRPSIYGLLAEFDSAEHVLDAAKRAYADGYRKLEAYSPFPVEGLDEAIGFHRSRVPLIVLLGGIAGGLTGFGMECFSAMYHYPINVGGRPLFSWPAFIPVTFELTVLFAAFSAVLGMLALNGLPKPYHPLFNVERFVLHGHDRFFLCVEATDPKFNREMTKRFLEGLQPKGVYEVEP